jgi:hypothetical protein
MFKVVLQGKTVGDPLLVDSVLETIVNPLKLTDGLAWDIVRNILMPERDTIEVP